VISIKDSAAAAAAAALMSGERNLRGLLAHITQRTAVRVTFIKNRSSRPIPYNLSDMMDIAHIQ